MSRFEWVRHPDAPACPCGRPIAPGTITPKGEQRHLGCDGKPRRPAALLPGYVGFDPRTRP